LITEMESRSRRRGYGICRRAGTTPRMLR
jgi:hypothetical protein